METKLDLYRIFIMVADRQSFSGAARELFMTQPAVSQAISQLENTLSVRLFSRTPKGVSLTNEGQLLFEYINSAMSLIGAGEKKLMEAKGLLAGELKAGAGDTISKSFLLPHLEKFHIKYPGIKLKIINRTTPELCSMLKSGEIDIGICNMPVNEPNFEVRKLIDVHDIFVCGEKYHSLIKGPLGLGETADYPLILLETKSNSRLYVESFFSSRGVKLTPEIELGSHDLLLEFARINLGLACVIKEFSEAYIKNGTLYEVPLEEEIPARSIGCCYLKNVSLSPASQKFIEILQSPA